MKTYSEEELKEILTKHALWLANKEGGERADLSEANLSGADLRWANLSGANLSGADSRWANLSRADLSGADLSRADLRWANLSEANLSRADLSRADLRWAYLSEANLSRADLSGADLSGADLSRADLRWANLSAIKEDLFTKLQPLKNESVGLYKAVIDGQIDGSCYEGECCCFVGTVAKNMGVHFQEMETLKPNANSPIERFFLAISKGDTPDNNPASAVVKEWLEEFMNNEGINIPTRNVNWS